MKAVKRFLEKIQRRNIVAQGLGWGIIAYIIFISITIGKFFSFKIIDIALFILLAGGLAIPLLVFLILVNILLPEIRNLYRTKDGFGPGLLKRFYYLFLFYLISGIIMQFMVDKLIEWMTSLGQGEPGLSAIYANILTPMLIFFVRKSGTEEQFRDILYANMLFVLFFMAIEIPVGGFAGLHAKFFVALAGMLFSTIFFTILDLALPRKSIGSWFK